MKKIRIAALLITLAVVTAIFAGCGTTDPVITIGSDEIPSLFSVVGERMITKSHSESANKEVYYSEKTYKSGAVTREDVDKYWDTLRAEGFYITVEAVESGTVTQAQLGKHSVDDGQIILVDLYFDSAGETTLTYRVGEGTLTIF